MTDQKYPHTPGYRSSAPETSREAAEHIAPIAGAIRAKVLDVVTARRSYGSTGDEVAVALDLHVTQVRSRLSELRAAGKIVDSGRRREGASGRRGSVWVLAEYGPRPIEDQADLFGEAA